MPFLGQAWYNLSKKRQHEYKHPRQACYPHQNSFITEFFVWLHFIKAFGLFACQLLMHFLAF